MNVTRDVVKDLLTVYLSGDASRDTRALVEEWLRTDPELARLAERAGTLDLPAAAPPTLEKKALEATKTLLRWRMILLGTAIYVTTLPLTITFDRNGYRGLLVDNWPERFVIFAIALALWYAFWRFTRRLRVAGL